MAKIVRMVKHSEKDQNCGNAQKMATVTVLNMAILVKLAHFDHSASLPISTILTISATDYLAILNVFFFLPF